MLVRAIFGVKSKDKKYIGKGLFININDTRLLFYIKSTSSSSLSSSSLASTPSKASFALTLTCVFLLTATTKELESKFKMINYEEEGSVIAPSCQS